MEKNSKEREKVKKRPAAEGKTPHKMINRLSVVIACVLIPLLAVTTVVTALLLRGTAKDELSKNADIGIHVFESVMDSRSVEMQNLANSCAFDASVITALNAGGSALSGAAEGLVSSDLTVFAAIFDAQGDLLWQQGTLPGNLTAQCGAAGAEIYTDETVAMYSCVAQTVTSSSGRQLGTVCVGYDMTDPVLVDEVKEISDVNITLFKGDTRVNTTILKNGERVIGTAMSAAVAAAVLTNGQEYTGELFVVTDNMLVKYVPLKNSAGDILGAIFAGQPTTSLDGAFAGSTAVIAAVVVVVLVALIVTLVFTMNKLLSAPILKVVTLAKEIEQGDLKSEPVVIAQNNEVRTLADAMNSTTAAMNSYITDIQRMLDAMAGKDLTVETTVEFRGDFLALDHALYDIRDRTAAFVGELSTLAERVHDSSQQVSLVSQSVAEGTTTQAESLEELAVTVSDVSDNIEKNAENAKRAKQVSDETERKVHEQSAKMDEAMSAMQDIEDKSAKIQNIIKTIEDIAFQTNILALNAAVEAARAGAAGKGFAVVADEVRNLANKSAEAANNTSKLIQTSIESVRSGADILNYTAQSLQAVVALSGETHALIDSIAAQSDSQAEAVKQIDAVLTQISEVVQQNSATAQETSAAGGELFRQSEELHALVQQYKI